MGTTIIAFTAVILYGAGTLLQALRIRSGNQRAGWLAQFTGVLAIAAHLSFALRFMVLEGGVNLSMLVAGTSIAALLAALVLILSLRYPVQPLLLIAYPIALLSLGVLLHVSLAITAFSLLALAAIQAVLLYLQHHHLKAHHSGFLVRALPPLETMEALLFGLIHTGVAILTLAIITGAIFVQDLFSQQLAHKTVFTLLAWLVFAALILGHQIRGWRGAVASRWTLAGCVLLTLGYFGSRLVIDVIL